jgi:hypothetical protein
MSKYQSFQKHKELPARRDVHPVWRGIGCLIMVILPVISWATAQLLLEFGKSQKWAFLYELSDYVRFPEWAYSTPYILILANYISSIPYLKALLMFSVLVLILLSGIFAFLNAILYRVVGPPRYTELDAPAPRVNVKRRSR